MEKKKRVSFGMFLVTIGIVYGDIGTSPLYVMKSILKGNGGIAHVNEDFILGALSLIALLSAVYMFRASGAMEALGALLAPALDKIGITAETAPLLFIRPISGSGALAVGSEIMDSYGVDSYVGRVAAEIGRAHV